MTWQPCGPCKRAGRTVRCEDPDCAHRVTAETEEIDAGITTGGRAGAMYRMLDRCDYRRVEGWLRGEVVMATPEHLIMDATVAAIASIALQIAGHRAQRGMIRETARVLMSTAANVLERDVATIIRAKKELTAAHNQIRIVPPG